MFAPSCFMSPPHGGSARWYPNLTHSLRCATLWPPASLAPVPCKYLKVSSLFYLKNVETSAVRLKAGLISLCFCYPAFRYAPCRATFRTSLRDFERISSEVFRFRFSCGLSTRAKKPNDFAFLAAWLKAMPWSFYIFRDGKRLGITRFSRFARASEAGGHRVAHSASCGCCFSKSPKARVAGDIKCCQSQTYRSS